MACRAGAAAAAVLGAGFGSGAAGALAFAWLTHGAVQTVPVMLAIGGALALCGAAVMLWEAATDQPFRGRIPDARDVERILRTTAKLAKGQYYVGPVMRR